MPPRDVCAWGGCDVRPRHGEKHCDFHRPRVVVERSTHEPDLFTQSPPCATHTPRASLPEALAEPIAGKASTSKRAAEGARAGFKSRKLLIHEHIIGEGAAGATRPEIAAALGVSVNSVNSACNTLYRQGYIGSNPGHERPDPVSGAACAVLVDEAHVERWKGQARAVRSWLAPFGECDLVHPDSGVSMSETERSRVLRAQPFDAEEGDA